MNPTSTFSSCLLCLTTRHPSSVCMYWCVCVCPETVCSASMCVAQAWMTPASNSMVSMWASMSLPLIFWLAALLSVPALPVLLRLCLLSAFQRHWLRWLRLLDFHWNPISCYLFNRYAGITSHNDFGRWQREMPRATRSSEKSSAFLLLLSHGCLTAKLLSQDADSLSCLLGHEIITCYIKVAACYSCIFSVFKSLVSVLSLALHCSTWELSDLHGFWYTMRDGIQNACLTPDMCPSSPAVPTITFQSQLYHSAAPGLDLLGNFGSATHTSSTAADCRQENLTDRQ